MSHARMVTLPCLLFELFPLNALEKGEPCTLEDILIIFGRHKHISRISMFLV